jgi:type I restriction enzyme S subunit
MTPEVKQRIEQIRQGIVPKGYKKTKTDIVPADWEESPIGEYIREYTEKTTIPNQYPVLTSARTGLMLQTDYYSNRQVTTEDNVGYNILPYGYITFRSRSDDGRFRFNENRIIERGVISYFYPVFSFSEEVCHEYMLYLLNFSIYRRMYPYAEGTAQQVLSLKKLGQLKYSLPLVAEQKKIAEILSTQDKTIELQGRKIEELKRFKKGCLEKMFPRKGQKVPETRFPGFTGDWEQRKAKELFVSTADKGYPELPVLSATQDRGMIRRDENSINIFHDKKNEAGYKRVLPGQFVIHLRSFQGGFAHSAIEGITSPAYTVFGFSEPEKHDSEYWKYVFTSKSFIQRLETVTYGIRDGRSISYEEFLTLGFVYPSKAEQTAIARYLDKLSDLITLHQRKLEEMKRQKKALMQLLLTGIVRVKT